MSKTRKKEQGASDFRRVAAPNNSSFVRRSLASSYNSPYTPAPLSSSSSSSESFSYSQSDEDLESPKNENLTEVDYAKSACQAELARYNGLSVLLKLKELNTEFEKLSVISLDVKDEDDFFKDNISSITQDIYAFNTDVRKQRDKLTNHINEINDAIGQLTTFSKAYEVQWKNNEAIEAKLIAIKKAFARAYYQTAEKYLETDILSKEKIAKMKLSSPESSPKKTSAVNSLEKQFKKRIGDANSVIQSFDEKFNLQEPDAQPLNIGIKNNQLNIAYAEFEKGILHLNLIQLQERANHILTQFSGSSVHDIRVKIESELGEDDVRISYDDSKKIGVFAWNTQLTKDESELNAQKKLLNHANLNQIAHINALRKQFSEKYPSQSKVLQYSTDAEIELKQKNNASYSNRRQSIQAGSEAEIFSNPLVESVVRSQVIFKNFNDKRNNLLHKLRQKKELYKRFNLVPNYIETLSNEEKALAQVKQEHQPNLNATEEQIKILQANIATLNGIIAAGNISSPASSPKKIKKSKKQSHKNSKSKMGDGQEKTPHENANLSSSSSEEIPAAPALSVAAQESEQSNRLSPKADKLKKKYEILKGNKKTFDENEAAISLLLETYDLNIKKISNKKQELLKEENKKNDTLKKFENEQKEKQNQIRQSHATQLQQLKDQLSLNMDNSNSSSSSEDSLSQLSQDVQAYQMPSENCSVDKVVACDTKIKSFKSRLHSLEMSQLNSNSNGEAPKSIRDSQSGSLSSNSGGGVPLKRSNSPKRPNPELPPASLRSTDNPVDANNIFQRNILSLWLFIVGIWSLFHRKEKPVKEAVYSSQVSFYAEISQYRAGAYSSTQKVQNRFKAAPYHGSKNKNGVIVPALEQDKISYENKGLFVNFCALLFNFSPSDNPSGQANNNVTQRKI